MLRYMIESNGTVLDQLDKFILSTLRTSKEPITTYELAKIAKVSWSTVNSRCYKLKSVGKIKGKTETSPMGLRKKKIWWLNEK